MGILSYGIRQSPYIPETLTPDLYVKPYKDYCRIKVINGKALKNISFKFNTVRTSSGQLEQWEKNPEKAQSIKKYLSLYYSIGTYELWTEEGGSAYESRQSPYVWYRCINGMEQIIDSSNFDNICYIYLLSAPANEWDITKHDWSIYDFYGYNLEVTVNNKMALLGTSKVELAGNLSSLYVGKQYEDWDDTDRYFIKFINSDFTSIGSLVLNDLSKLTNGYRRARGGACSYLFQNNKYLKDIPDSFKTIYEEKCEKNQDGIYYKTFDSCTSLEDITINVIAAPSSSYYYKPLKETFTNCNSLRKVTINYDWNITGDAGSQRLDGVYDSPFAYCPSLYDIKINMESPISPLVPNASKDITIGSGSGNILNLFGAREQSNFTSFASAGANATGKNVVYKYVSFPKFDTDATWDGYTNQDLVQEFADDLSYDNEYYGTGNKWYPGYPVNINIGSNIGKGDGFDVNMNIYIGTTNEGNYHINDLVTIGSIKCPYDTIFSGIIDDIDEKLSHFTIGSMTCQVNNEYIIGSATNDYDNLYILCSDKLYNNSSIEVNNYTKVKVTEFLFSETPNKEPDKEYYGNLIFNIWDGTY